MGIKGFKTQPGDYGKGTRICRICRGRRGIIRKYNLMVCRRCFREHHKTLGFQQLD